MSLWHHIWLYSSLPILALITSFCYTLVLFINRDKVLSSLKVSEYSCIYCAVEIRISHAHLMTSICQCVVPGIFFPATNNKIAVTEQWQIGKGYQLCQWIMRIFMFNWIVLNFNVYCFILSNRELILCSCWWEWFATELL